MLILTAGHKVEASEVHGIYTLSSRWSGGLERGASSLCSELHCSLSTDHLLLLVATDGALLLYNAVVLHKDSAWQNSRAVISQSA